jgi:hypothetical protein
MPTSFTKPLIVQKISARRWMLHSEFDYHVGMYPSADVIKVPIGFQTDFASVPRPFWFLFPPDGKYTGAAVVHDWLYHTHEYHERSRKECDQIFLEAMGVLGVPWLTRHTMYRAVRLGGGNHFK